MCVPAAMSAQSSCSYLCLHFPTMPACLRGSVPVTGEPGRDKRDDTRYGPDAAEEDIVGFSPGVVGHRRVIHDQKEDCDPTEIIDVVDALGKTRDHKPIITIKKLPHSEAAIGG